MLIIVSRCQLQLLLSKCITTDSWSSLLYLAVKPVKSYT